MVTHVVELQVEAVQCLVVAESGGEQTGAVLAELVVSASEQAGER